MRKILAMLLVSIGISGYAADNIYVRTQSGDIAEPLAQIALITFPQEGGVVIQHVDGSSTTYAAADFKLLTYTPQESAVESVATRSEAISVSETAVYAPAEVVIYDLAGAEIARSTSGVIDITDLQTGVYVAKSGVESVKFVKK
jgi:hypothetical protein